MEFDNILLTSSGLESLCVNLCIYRIKKKIWPLTHIRILFPLNSLRKNIWNSTKYGICIDID